MRFAQRTAIHIIFGSFALARGYQDMLAEFI